MSNIFSADFAGRNISLKTNYVAGQADGSVLVYYGDTVVLITAVSLKGARAGIDFLPLTVDYQEMTFAAGKIPGGFFKREGRLNEREVLISRIIDRSIRPLFPKGYYSETQLVATVLSVDDENDPEIAAMLGASAALEMSNIPFKGPVAGVRIGRINSELVCNASPADMLTSELNIFMVGRKITPGTEGRDYDVELVMLEGDAREVDEDVIVDAIKFGLEALRPVIDLQDKMRQAVGREKRTVEEIVTDEELTSKVRAAALAGLEEGYNMPRKLERYGKLDEVREKVIREIGGEDAAVSKKVAGIIEEIERRILRDMIIRDKKRIDGRSSTDIRPISSEVGILPRVHGSALFNRGETQAVVALTLGTSSDEQRLDYVIGEERRSFMLHYNFPPYSVGEAKPLRSPGRREIGHGALARKALVPVLPSTEAFPYTIRIVSEILSSNGSSSMATVCGGTLSLMDAGQAHEESDAGDGGEY